MNDRSPEICNRASRCHVSMRGYIRTPIWEDVGVDLRDAFTTAMVFLTIAVPVSITCILTVMLRIAGGGGLPRRMDYPPPGVVARADEVAARMRAHLRSRRQAPDPELLHPAGSMSEVPTLPFRERRHDLLPGATPRAA